MHRARSGLEREAAAAFRDWGIPTAEAVRQVHQAVPHLPLIASGGIRDGIQVAKAIAMGAAACGIAHPFLLAAARSAEAVVEAIEVIVTQLRVAMFAAGARDLAALARVPLIEVPRRTEEER